MKTSDFTRAAVLAALITVLLLLGFYLPQLSLVTPYFAACAVVLLVVSVPVRPAALAVAVACILSALLSNVAYALLYGLLYCLLPGFLTGILFRGRKNIQTIFIGSTAAYLGATVLVLWISSMMANTSIVDFIREPIDAVFDSMAQLGAAANAEQQGMVTQMLQQMKSTFLLYIPSLLICNGGMMSVIAIYISRAVLNRMGLSYQYLPAFSRLMPPRGLAYSYIIFMLAGFFVPPGSSFEGLLANVLMILWLLLFIFGLSLVKYYINKIPTVGAVQNLIFIVLFPFLMLLSQLVVFVSAADAFWNFRKPKGVM